VHEVAQTTVLAGKAKRVVGFFVAMVGAGIVLDSSAGWTGAVIMLAGLALFIWGVAAAKPRATVTLPEPDSRAAAPATSPTEGNV
jgi:protein-S-isoprenylcysteine O-methyltransferase Ste14